ncbi:hypothetical protein BC826DRAFT_965865 [Russula brevipes]|nr:hypothetical protein BC826DRAFT_965865 [Russula brevipes]
MPLHFSTHGERTSSNLALAHVVYLRRARNDLSATALLDTGMYGVLTIYTGRSLICQGCTPIDSMLPKYNTALLWFGGAVEAMGHRRRAVSRFCTALPEMSAGSSPPLLPPSRGFTVRVWALHTGRLLVPTAVMVQSPISGHDVMDLPIYCFIVENPNTGERVLFDLGLMKAWEEKQPSHVLDHVQSTNSTLEVTSDVVDILKSASVPLDSFHALIWSHHHVCHAGDVSLFPQDIPLVVGRGFKSNSKTHPGYPQNPGAHTLQDAFEGRELVELDFNNDHAHAHARAKAKKDIIICGLRAIDWFGDASFYLLEAPGHSSDHIMGLARTAEDKFVLLGGDAAHHAGEFRPSASVPLPESIVPSPFGPPDSRSSCPGSAFESVHPATAEAADTPGAFRITPFYTVAPFMQTDPVAYRTTLEAVVTLDASPDVFVTFAHDSSLCDIFEVYPKGELTEWYKDGETSKKEIGRWRFLKDFQVT